MADTVPEQHPSPGVVVPRAMIEGPAEPLSWEERWGWGDRPTWGWIAAMCAFGLIIALVAYVMPMGRVATLPPIKVY